MDKEIFVILRCPVCEDHRSLKVKEGRLYERPLFRLDRHICQVTDCPKPAISELALVTELAESVIC